MTTAHTSRTQGRTGGETVVFHHPDHTLAMVRGDLDIATAPTLRERLIGALRPRTGPLILDLSGVSFCDAAGLAMLIGTQRRAAALGIAMLLVAPGPRLCALLGVTGLDRSLSVHQTMADALSRHVEPAPGGRTRVPARRLSPAS